MTSASSSLRLPRLRATATSFEIDQGLAYDGPPGGPVYPAQKYVFSSGSLTNDPFVTGCGFCDTNLLPGGAALFTGPTSSPTFVTGIFAEIATTDPVRVPVDDAGILVTSDIASPEPSTLTLLGLGGFSIAFYLFVAKALRRIDFC